MKGTYTYQYDEVGSRTHLEYAPELAPAVVASWEYDLLGRLNTLTHREGTIQAPGDVLTKYTYEHRKDGRRSRMTEWREGNLARDVSYAYDALNRLILEESEFSGQSQHDYTHEYAFDLVGNRFSKTVLTSDPTKTTLYIYDDNDWLLEEWLEVDGSSPVKTVDYDYDHNGFMTEKDADGVIEEYTPNIEGRLWRYERAGLVVDYRYDYRGIRAAAAVQGGAHRRYLVDHHNHTGYAQILQEREGTGPDPFSIVKSYIIGDDVLAEATEFTLYHLLQDGHGSTGALHDPSTMSPIIERYWYDAYGNGVADFDPATALTELLYCGEQRDVDLGWYYLRARYYDPANGRFNRMDPYWGSPDDPLTLHKYAYCHADPVNATDPSGNVTFSEMKMRIWGHLQLFQMKVRSAVRVADRSFLAVIRRIIQMNLAYGRTDPSLVNVIRKADRYNRGELRRLRNMRSVPAGFHRRIRTVVGVLLNRQHAAAHANVSDLPLKPTGFYDFTHYLHRVSPTVYVRLTGSRRQDERRANIRRRRAGGEPDTPEGFTWHHHEIMGIMQLVRTEANQGAGHYGGPFFWQITRNQPYKK